MFIVCMVFFVELIIKWMFAKKKGKEVTTAESAEGDDFQRHSSTIAINDDEPARKD